MGSRHCASTRCCLRCKESTTLTHCSNESTEVQAYLVAHHSIIDSAPISRYHKDGGPEKRAFDLRVAHTRCDVIDILFSAHSKTCKMSASASRSRASTSSQARNRAKKENAVAQVNNNHPCSFLSDAEYDTLCTCVYRLLW